jgi:hypothetical protein
MSHRISPPAALEPAGRRLPAEKQANIEYKRESIPQSGRAG